MLLRYMTLKVFTGKGALERLGKKKVLSNKALTRRVRAISGTKGTRVTVQQNVVNAITLVANTAQLFPLSILNALSNVILHNVRVFVRWQSIINSANRLIVWEDIQATSTAIVSATILERENDIMSAYQSDGELMHPFSAKRLDKNLGTFPRVRILKDMMWTDSENVAGVDIIKLFRFDIKLSNRKSDTDLSWGIFIMSDQSNTPIDIQYTVDHTTGV